MYDDLWFEPMPTLDPFAPPPEPETPWALDVVGPSVEDFEYDEVVYSSTSSTADAMREILRRILGDAVDDIIVTGEYPWFDPDLVRPETLPGDGEGPSGGGGQPLDLDLDQDGYNGFDCAVNSIKDAINDLSTNDTNEHVAIVFMGPDGKYHASPPFTGAGGSVDYAQLGQWMLSRGLSISDIVGLYHNHPSATSTNPDPDLHRYPSNRFSVGLGLPNDWSVAAAFVSNGANPSRFVMIVEDQNGDVRYFRYDEKEKYEDLTVAEMEARKNLPDENGDCGQGNGE